MSSNLALPPLPATLKSIAHHLKTAVEHESRDPVVTYWCRLCALQTALKLDKSSAEAKAVLLPLMDWLEKEKRTLGANEAVTNDVVASAHLENYALKLFGWADKEDRAARFNKNVVKAFYTCGMLLDVLVLFGELTPENAHARKYAKWKAAYIHNCLKSGVTPVPGPAANDDDDQDELQEKHDAGGWQMPTQGSFEGPSSSTMTPGATVPSASAFPPPAAASHPAPVPTPRVNAHPPQVPAAQPVTAATAMTTSSGSSLTPEQITKARKYCKYAGSALDYDDKATAIDNLQKCLRLLQTGED